MMYFFFFFSSRRRHTRLQGDWSSDVCSSDLASTVQVAVATAAQAGVLGVDAHVGTVVPAAVALGMAAGCDGGLQGLACQGLGRRGDEDELQVVAQALQIGRAHV